MFPAEPRSEQSTARPPRAPVAVFVAATGNAFMADIASWLVEATRATGREADLVTDALPCVDGRLNLVVAPHEYFELTDASRRDLQHAAAASIAVCTEQPGTPWFHLSVDAARRGLAALDINAHGVDALRAVGVNAHRLRLGAVASMRVPVAETNLVDRRLDVAFLGGHDPRRGAVLAELAPRLIRRRSDLRLFRFDRPVTAETPGLVFGRDKYELLASARVLVNIHRDRSDQYPPGEEPPAYFEWARLVEAMANGCVVLTEPSADHEPLVAGEHFLSAPAEELGDALDALLDDPDRLAQISAAAAEAVRGPLALEASMAPTLDRLDREVIPNLDRHVRTSRPHRGLWRLGATRQPPPVRLGAFRPYLALQAEAKRLALAENEALRRLDGLACLLRHGETQHIRRWSTPAHERADTAPPEVSVVVTVYNYASVVTETLESIVASEDVDHEIIIVEDHATDDSRAVLTAFLDAHPEVPILLLAKDANEGLAAARNSGFAEARAELVMVMDADNLVYPTALRRLADRLQADPGAAATYSILEDFGAQRDVRSALAWDVERLCAANYLDAQAMWRRSVWETLGGYRADEDLVYGWEDWDLWLRLADRGGRAVLHPEILGRYRVQPGSMIALTNLATDEPVRAIRRRYPHLPWPDGDVDHR